MKKLLSFITIVLLTFGLSACMQTSEEAADTGIENIRETSVEEGNLQKAQNMIQNFVYAIEDQNVEEAVRYINVPDGAFYTADDIWYLLIRSPFGDITGVNAPISGLTIGGSAIEKQASFKVGNHEFILDLILAKDNTWKLSTSFFIENYTIRVPAGMEVTIDGRSITEYKQDWQQGVSYDSYRLPAIVDKTHNLIAVSKLYGSFAQELTTSTSSDTFTMVCKVSDAETKNILSQVMEIWNGMYDAYEKGATAEQLRPFVTDNVDTNLLTEILAKGFPKLEKGSSTSYSGFYMSKIFPKTNDTYGAAILETTNSVNVKFGYTLEFISADGQYFNKNKYSALIMKYIENEGVYKIDQIPDTALFTDADFTRNDF